MSDLEHTHLVRSVEHLAPTVPYRLRRINLRAQRETVWLRDAPAGTHRAAEQLPQRGRDIVAIPRCAISPKNNQMRSAH